MIGSSIFTEPPMLHSLAFTNIPAQDEALRSEVRAFLDDSLRHLPADLRARSWSGFDADFSRRLAQRGWVGLTLPVEYGGGGRSAFARYVLVEELLNAGAPVAAHWIADRQSAPLILRFGSEEQKRFYVPRVCRGEAFFCIGMSEPGSGSDLASVRSRATRSADGWRLDGQKIWTTNAYRTQYMIALVRSSGSAEGRQQGLSQFIVDLAAPGITVRPIADLTGEEHFCEVFFDNVALPENALIGNEGEGWKQVTAELAFERSGPERLYSCMALLTEWLDLLRQGSDEPDAVRLLGRLVSQLAVLRAMSIAVTEKLARGESPVTEAALVKDLGTELEQSMPLAISDSLCADPARVLSPLLLRTLTYLTQIAPSFSLRGGTREILRGMIARGLGLR